jgi:L-ascorbate metabolism protein UlaG (beta-lactamase superfamily)
MSAVTETPVGVLCTDPTGGAIGTRIIRRLTSVSHEHHGSFNPATLEDLTGPDTRLVVPPYVMDGLPEGLADTGVSFPNGQRSELSGVVIEAGPSYGTSGEAHAGIRRGAAMGTEGVDDHSR